MNKAGTTSAAFLNKGLFAIAIVAVVSIVGVAGFARAATNDLAPGSGYGGNGEQALAAADELEAAVAAGNTTFTTKLDNLSDQAKSSLSPAGDAQVDAFNAKFDMYSGQYDAALAAAFDDFRAAVMDAQNSAESKDEFIDKFNNAKANYFNALDAAKNQFAAQLSGMGDQANQAKDQFIGGFNTARDAYGNQLEQAKNDFANTMSNL